MRDEIRTIKTAIDSETQDEISTVDVFAKKLPDAYTIIIKTTENGKEQASTFIAKSWSNVFILLSSGNLLSICRTASMCE